MEFFDLSEAAQAKKYVSSVLFYSCLFSTTLTCDIFKLVLRYAFKCHRKSEAGRDIVYPVNAIAFHPM